MCHAPQVIRGTEATSLPLPSREREGGAALGRVAGRERRTGSYDAERRPMLLLRPHLNRYDDTAGVAAPGLRKRENRHSMCDTICFK